MDRLNGVVTAFLNYARPLKQTFAPTDLNEVSTRTARLIQNDLPSFLTTSQTISLSIIALGVWWFRRPATKADASP